MPDIVQSRMIEGRCVLSRKGNTVVLCSAFRTILVVKPLFVLSSQLVKWLRLSGASSPSEVLRTLPGHLTYLRNTNVQVHHIPSSQHSHPTTSGSLPLLSQDKH